MNVAVMPSGVGRSGKWEAASEERERCIVGEGKGRVPLSRGADPIFPHPPEHMDMDKWALKQPVFSSSWSELAEKSPKYLDLSPALSELSKSPVCVFPKTHRASPPGDDCQPPMAEGWLLRERGSDTATS